MPANKRFDNVDNNKEIKIGTTDDFKDILIVDDNKLTCQRLSLSMGKPDRRIEVAHNAETALKLILERRFSLVLVDLLMPGMSGQDLIREIRQRNLPVGIIVLTGDPTLDAVVKALENGADDYLRKPYKEKRLEALASKLIDKYSNIKYYDVSLHQDFIEASRLPLPPEPPPATPPTPDMERLRHLDGLLPTISDQANYEDIAQRYEGVHRDLKQRFMARILPALKEEMQRQDHDTYDDKKNLVKWTNVELRRFDLTIKHPKTGEPASLAAKTGTYESGAFELKGMDVSGKEKTFTTPHLETLLANLELMEAPARREALAEWNERVGKQPRGRKR